MGHSSGGCHVGNFNPPGGVADDRCVSHLGRRATLKAFPVPSCAEGSAAGSRLGLCVAGDQVTHMRASADQQNIVSMAVEEEHETCVCLLADVSA